ncbi:hypothetical protein M622_12905 [Thauera terpenica 58Eu]|uniref:Type I restriction modification DNA specificity domain-containing protein n=1 Tax=Thauera terpenica 58Eu TaxID=1348657 RepID=T0B0X0_9RHOO|nr:restriction endonuclease subunit S [Thauera terpenica]EPZ16448.1 hypothetical protein M622_12905 [Thauera terpenica 58Eu]
MSFPRYPEYKDSGVEWLGEVPSHWEISRIKQLFEICKRIAGTEGFDVLSITQSGIQVKDTESGGGQLSMDYSKYQLVEIGDFAMNHMDLLTGYVDVSKTIGVTSPDYRVFRLRNAAACSRYFLYLFQNAYKRKIFFPFGQGSSLLGRWRLPTDEFNAFNIPLPPSAEQTRIAAFLDRETAKIDALVAEQQSLIALLKEKRQALISHAVTKGLDPDVPMKDSGVAWLGEVPAHWTLTKLKYSTSHIIDCPHETPTYCPDGDYLVVRTADVDAGALDLSNAYRLDEVEYLKRTRRAKLVPQDIVYGREGERWGYAATVPDEPVLCLGQRMMQFRARAGIAPRFLMWQLNSDVTYRQGQVDTVGATSPHVNVSTIANYVLTEPPFSEQVEIANYVDGATSEIDDLVSEARATVELLQERRTALISAAVTGKIDVRHLAVATADPTPEPA